MKKSRMRSYFTGGKKLPNLPFMGEMMTCKNCGKRQKSNPKIESGWTSVTIENTRFYICPECFDRLSGGQ